jgi:hypothetical protein
MLRSPVRGPPFHGLPEEGAIIGRLVVGYGELEFGLSLCLGVVLGDEDQALRVLFRVQSAGGRINVAEALMRPLHEKANLTDIYGETMGALRYCKGVRDQYAHSHWAIVDGGLHFGNLEKAAEPPTGSPTIFLAPIDLAVLQAQEKYFIYTRRLLDHLRAVWDHAAGKKPTAPATVPTGMLQPPKNNLPPKKLSKPVGKPIRSAKPGRAN